MIEGLMIWSLVTLCGAQPSDQHGSSSDVSHIPGGRWSWDAGPGEGFIEPWMYIHVPGYGTYSMREVNRAGSEGQWAFDSYNKPLVAYEPIAIFVPSTSQPDAGLTVLIPIVRCLGDFTGDHVVDAGDLLPFALAFLADDLSADLNGDGVLDIVDQLVFFTLATMGCVQAA